MSDRASAALAVWRDRAPRSNGDRAYFAYALGITLLVVAAPLARDIWLLVTTPQAVAALSSAHASVVIACTVYGLWGASLVAGTSRGPAILPPVLVAILVESTIPRRRVFRRTMTTAGLCTIVTCSLAAAVCAGGLVDSASISTASGLAFVTAGALVGVVTLVAWLLGQAFPRASRGAALLMAALGIAPLLRPGFGVLVPWAWPAQVFRDGPTVPALGPLLGLSSLLATTVPAVLEHLDGDDVLLQARRWDTAMAHLTSLEMSSVASTFTRPPSMGRRLPGALPSRSTIGMILLSDLVGSIRTPGRLVAGLLLLACSGVAVALSHEESGWSLACAALAGLLVYAGIGKLADGLYHAARASSDYPLYGISDSRLVIAHALFPGLSVVFTTLVATGIADGSGQRWRESLIACTVTAAAALVARASDAVRGPTPLFLLTPAPSPMGDPMPLFRLFWALDAPVLSALAGCAAVVVTSNPTPAILVVGVVTVTFVVRWLRRA